MKRRSFVCASAASALLFPQAARAADAEGLRARLQRREVAPPRSLAEGPPSLIEGLSAAQLAASWSSVMPTGTASPALLAAAQADALRIGDAALGLAAWLRATPDALLRRRLEQLLEDRALEGRWRGAMTAGAEGPARRRLSRQVDSALLELLTDDPLAALRAALDRMEAATLRAGFPTGALSGPARPIASRAPPGQRVALGAVIAGLGGLLLTKGVLGLAAAGLAMWPALFAGLGALILAIGVGVLVVAAREIKR